MNWFSILLIFCLIGGVLSIFKKSKEEEDFESLYEVDWSRSWYLGLAYKPRKPKITVLETTDINGEKSNIAIISSPNIEVETARVILNGGLKEPNEGRRLKYHEPVFDDLTCREPSYDGGYGHEPDFNIDSFDDVNDTEVMDYVNPEPSYESNDGHEPSYD